MCLTLRGQVRGILGQPLSRSHLLTNWRPIRLHAVRCHCSFTELNMRVLCIDLWLRSLVHIQGFFCRCCIITFQWLWPFQLSRRCTQCFRQWLCIMFGICKSHFFCWTNSVISCELTFLAGFCFWWHLIQREIISESPPQPVYLFKAVSANNYGPRIKCQQMQPSKWSYPGQCHTCHTGTKDLVRKSTIAVYR